MPLAPRLPLAWLIRRVRRLGLLAHFSIVGLTVGILVAAGLAWFIEVRLTDLLLVNAAARAADQVGYLSLTGYLTADDFAAPHTPDRLASIAGRLDPLLARVRDDGSGVIRLQMFARDATVLYADLPDKRGQQIDLDDAEHLTEALEGHVEREISDLDGPENRELRETYHEALEVYVPVKLNGEIVGVYEVYQDLASVRAVRPVVWGAVLSGFGLLFVALLGVVCAGAVLMRRFAYQAFHDVLTNLPNRALFLDRVGAALARHGRPPVAVLFVDLDGLKLVNDSLGHAAGDIVLAAVAGRLASSCLSPNNTVARLGGDEFSILLEEVGAATAAVACAERILAALRTPLVVGGRELFPTGSIGITLSTPQTVSAEALLREADAAMYRAKTRGKDGYAVFDRSMATHATERLALETDLRSGLERREFCLHYQPILALDDGHIAEVEALVRWQHRERGLVPPAMFIPVAEETGFIIALGQWVLEEACRQAAAWRAALGERAPVMSVNLSARKFQRPELLADIRRALRTARLDPSGLKLEITESVIMQDAKTTVETLHSLKALGIGLAIDDFGTGYSSLAYLKRFPVDTIKIDRSFVYGLGDDPQDTAIVESIVALGRALDLSLTAEGIETEAQRELLRTLGCERGQGFLFARPGPADEVEPLLRVAPAARRLRAA